MIENKWLNSSAKKCKEQYQRWKENLYSKRDFGVPATNCNVQALLENWFEQIIFKSWPIQRYWLFIQFLTLVWYYC
jgi:hypothetical protein